MSHIIQLSLPLLVGAMIYASLCTYGAHARVRLPLTCTSPCQHTDASQVSNTDLPPCTITTNCWNRDTVPSHEAPGGPLQMGMGSSSIVGPDGKVYLEMSPHWKASSDRISLLTGYEVKVMCNRNVCASQSFCVTVSFNRTLTIQDIHSNFSVSCQYGNFSQPSMEYVTLIRSLPKSEDDSNKGSLIAALPSCEQEPSVSLCHIESPENWEPAYRPFIRQIANGSVVVSFWPSTNKIYPGYHVLLREVILPGVRKVPNEFEAYFDSERDGSPFVHFNNVPEGNYEAFVSIDKRDCPSCMLYRSSNNITVHAMPTPAPPAPSTTLHTNTLPYKEPPKEVTIPYNPGSPIPMAALAGALGGILCVILILVLIARTRKRNSAPQRRRPSGDGKEREYNVERTSMLHCNNIPYDDCDSITGTGYINQWPPPHSNGDYDHNLFGISNPSMVPIETNGRLVQESEYYARTRGYQGDSISKVAVDVHSSTNHQTSFKGGLPPIQQPDSGVESIYSEDTDGQTLFSLALTNVGDEV